MKTKELQDALAYTAELTGFQQALIEKDYYCSLILKKIYESNEFQNELIFKGGTLLSKCFFEFFRMSEDLDFSVANEHCHDRPTRRKIADKMRKIIPELLAELNLKEISPFRGFNESRQYNGTFAYDSIASTKGLIKFEIGFRGDLLLPPNTILLKTLLKDPLSGAFCLLPFNGVTLQKDEAMAEKIRAALTRKNPAIRDFFDIEAAASDGFDFESSQFHSLVASKLLADVENPPNLTLEKKLALEQQILRELNPVLKANQVFDLEKSWTIATKLNDYLCRK